MAEEIKEEVKPKEEDTHTKLIEMVDRLEKANEVAKKILSRQEELIARNLLGGQTDAGIQPVQPKVETPKEYKDRILKGG